MVLSPKTRFDMCGTQKHQMGVRDKGSLAGKLIMAIGIPLCGLVGVIIAAPWASATVTLTLAAALIAVVYRRRRSLAGLMTR